MGAGAFFAEFAEKIKKLPSIITGILPGPSRIKINPVIVKIAGAAVLIIIALLLILLIASRPRTGKGQERPFFDSSRESIERTTRPGEGFFLPYEPDFIPDVLLEREPKESWTEEDTRPFWTDPLEGNEGVWRKRIESGIDSFLESVP